MAWIYLAESEECPSLCRNGLDPLPIAKSTPIVKESCLIKWHRNWFLWPQSGTTFDLWMAIRPLGKIVSTSFTVDSHVKISVLQDMERGWMESEADYFSRSC